MKNEEKRIAFVEERDGPEAAYAFVVQTYKIYKKALMLSRKRGCERPHFASLPEYRRNFIESCVVFRAYKSQHQKG